MAQLCTPVADDATAELLGVQKNNKPWVDADLNRTVPINSRKRKDPEADPVGGGDAAGGRREICPVWSEDDEIAELQQGFFENPLRVFDASKHGHNLPEAKVPEEAAADMKTFGPLYARVVQTCVENMPMMANVWTPTDNSEEEKAKKMGETFKVASSPWYVKANDADPPEVADGWQPDDEMHRETLRGDQNQINEIHVWSAQFWTMVDILIRSVGSRSSDRSAEDVYEIERYEFWNTLDGCTMADEVMAAMVWHHDIDEDVEEDEQVAQNAI